MKILVRFRCDHEQDVTMRDVERTVGRCGACGCTRAIDQVIVKEWKADCYDCRFRKWCGADEQGARDAATAHWKRCPSHRVTHRRTGRPGSQKAQETLIRKVGPVVH